MMKPLAFLWSGCWHSWKPTGIITGVFDTTFGNAEAPSYREMRYECDRCHRVKEWRI